MLENVVTSEASPMKVGVCNNIDQSGSRRHEVSPKIKQEQVSFKELVADVNHVQVHELSGEKTHGTHLN